MFVCIQVLQECWNFGDFQGLIFIYITMLLFTLQFIHTLPLVVDWWFPRQIVSSCLAVVDQLGICLNGVHYSLSMSSKKNSPPLAQNFFWSVCVCVCKRQHVSAVH